MLNKLGYIYRPPSETSISDFVSPKYKSPISQRIDPNNPNDKASLKSVLIGLGITIGATMLLKGPVSKAIGRTIRGSAEHGGLGFVSRLAKTAKASGIFNTTTEGATDILRLSKNWRDFETRITSTFARPMEGFKAFREIGKNQKWSAARRLYNFWKPTTIGGFTRGTRVSGYLYNKAVTTAAFIPPAYIVDRVLNPSNEKRPRWYDIKGNIKDFAKFGASFIPFELITPAVGSSISIVGRKSLNLAAKYTNTPAGRKFFSKIIQGVAKSSKVTGDYGRAIIRTIKELNSNITRFLPISRVANNPNRYNYRINIRSYPNKVSRIVQTFSEHLAKAKQVRKVPLTIAPIRSKESHQIIDKGLNSFLRKTSHIESPSQDSAEFVQDIVESYKKGHKGFLEKLFGLQRVSLEKEQIQTIVNKLRKSGAAREDIEDLLKEGLYHKEGVYTNGNEILDLRKLSPKRIAKLLNLKITKSRWSAPFHLTGIVSLLQHIGSTDYYSWTPRIGSEYVSPTGKVYMHQVKVNDAISEVDKYIYSKGKMYAKLADSKIIKIPGEENIKAIFSPGHTINKRIISDFATSKDPQHIYEKQLAPKGLINRMRASLSNSFLSSFFSGKTKYSDAFKILSETDQYMPVEKGLERALLYRRVYNNLLNKFDDAVHQQEVRNKVKDLFIKNKMGEVNPFEIGNDKLYEVLSEVGQGNSLLGKAARNYTNDLSTIAAELDDNIDNVLSSLPDKRRIGESLALLNSLGKMSDAYDVSQSLVGKLGADESLMLKSWKILSKSPDFDLSDENSVRSILKFLHKNSPTLKSISDYYKTSGLFTKDIISAVTLDNPFERVYGGEVPYYFISKSHNGVSDIAGSLLNLFSFGGAKADPTETKVQGLFRLLTTNRPLTTPKKTVMSAPYLWYSRATSGFRRLATELGVGPSVKEPLTAHSNMAFISRRIKQLMIGSAAYVAADTLLSKSKAADKTSFDEGLTVYAAEKFGQAEMLSATVRDKLGITSSAKYMESLMPGSSTLIPGAVTGALLARGKGGPFGMLTGALAGAAIFQSARAIGLLTPYKDAKTTADEISGRKLVARKRRRFWFLSLEPFAGHGTEYYIPGAIARTRAKYSDYKGSVLHQLTHRPIPFLGINPIGYLFDPYYQERQHYFTHPEPYTGRLFSNIPVVGTPLSVLSRVMKPQELMHRPQMEAAESGLNPPEVAPHRPGSASSLLSEFYHKSTVELLGLPGYKIERVIGVRPIGPSVEYEEAGREHSMEKSYWQAGAGDILFGGTEFARRFLPATNRALTYNPITNMMPSGFPNEFKTGNPFARIPYGNIRLPGEAYEQIHNVSHTFPLEGGSLGYSMQVVMQKMLGLVPPGADEIANDSPKGRMIKQQIQSNYIAQRKLLAANKMVYDAKSNVLGFIDAIVQSYSGKKEPVIIKTYSEDNPPNKARERDVHEMNFYLGMLKGESGRIIYVNRENPNETSQFGVNFMPNLLANDLKKIELARNKAKKALEANIIKRTGASYSWLDRFKILSDIAPTSNEYRQAETIVRTQIAQGMLTPDKMRTFNYYRQMRNKKLNRYDVYPYRFSGPGFKTETPGIQQVNIGSPEETPLATRKGKEAYINYYNDNPYFYPATAYSYPERVLGRIWEKLSHMQTFFHRKFINQYTTRQLYELQSVYGDSFRPWNEPIQSWLKPQIYSIKGANSPIEGAWHGGTLGFIAGGPVGALAGSAAGLVANVGTKAYSALSGKTYIPEQKKFQNQVNEWTDAIKYWKSRMEFETSGSIVAENDMKTTLLGAQNRRDLFKAIPGVEKSYFGSFIQERDPKEQERIYNISPDYLKPLLLREWGYSNNKTNRIYTPSLPNADWSGWSESVPTDDIKASIVADEGYKLHDFGLAFGEDKLRMSDTHLEEVHEDLIDSLPPRPDTLNIIQTIRSIVGGKASVSSEGRDLNQITVVIR